MDIKEKILKLKGTRLICGWCRKEFYTDTKRNKETGTFIPIVHCGRILPASKIEFTGNVVGVKHHHTEYKDGDVAG